MGDKLRILCNKRPLYDVNFALDVPCLPNSRPPMTVKVARSYLYACWLCFLFAFFRMKDSTDFYDFLHP